MIPNLVFAPDHLGLATEEPDFGPFLRAVDDPGDSDTESVLGEPLEAGCTFYDVADADSDELDGPDARGADIPDGVVDDPQHVSEADPAPGPEASSLYTDSVAEHVAAHQAILQHGPVPSFSAADLYSLEVLLFKWAIPNHMMFKRRGSQPVQRPGCRKRHYILYQCILGNHHQDKVEPAARQKPVKTRLTGCGFAIKVNLEYPDGEPRYVVKGYYKQRDSTTHNHPPIGRGQSAKMRPMDPAIKALIRSWVNSAMSPLDIYQQITRLHPAEAHDLLVADITRERRRARAERLCGTNSAEYLRRFLAEHAEDRGYLYRMDQRVGDDTLHGLIWSTTSARALFHRFWKVLSIDVTYNGDRHGHKILHIAGFTATNHSFTVALAAMPDESEETITRYLRYFRDLMGPVTPKVVVTDRAMAIRNAVHAVWSPRTTSIVLCLWHILQNLRTKIATATWPQRRAAPHRVPGFGPPAEPGGGQEGSGESTPEPLPDAEASSQAVGAVQRPVELTALESRCNRDLVIVDGRVLDREDWNKISREIRKTYKRWIVYGKTEAELQNGLRAWQDRWLAPQWRRIFDGVVEAGLRYVEEDGRAFIHLYINEWCHFNQRTTSRLEGMHSSLQSYIGIRARRLQLPIDELVRCTLVKFQNQWTAILAAMDYQSGFKPSENSRDLTHAVKTMVSDFSLGLLTTQIGLAKNIIRLARHEEFYADGRRIPAAKDCTGQFAKSMGLPCAHKLAEIQQVGSGVLDLEDFDKQWWLTKPAKMESIRAEVNEKVADGNSVFDIDLGDRSGQRRLRDPVLAAARRMAGDASAPSASQSQPAGPTASTGRTLSQFEVAEGGPDRQPTPRCPACRMAHDPVLHPCRAGRAAAVAVQRSQTEGGAEQGRRAVAATPVRPGARRGRDGVTDEALFLSLNLGEEYLRMRAADCPRCPMCGKHHTRQWCQRLRTWRLWYQAREDAREVAEGLGDSQASGNPESATSAEPARAETRDTASEASEAIVRAEAMSVPSSPNRLDFYSPMSSPNSDLGGLLQSTTDWQEVVRTQRLGSVHHEYVFEQPSQVSNGPRETSVESHSTVSAVAVGGAASATARTPPGVISDEGVMAYRRFSSPTMPKRRRL